MPLTALIAVTINKVLKIKTMTKRSNLARIPRYMERPFGFYGEIF